VDKIPGGDREKHERQAKEELKEEEPDAHHIAHEREPPDPGLYRELSIMIMVMSGLSRYIPGILELGFQGCLFREAKVPPPHLRGYVRKDHFSDG